MSEHGKEIPGEKPNVEFDYGSTERARMTPGEPKKHIQDQGGVEESKPPGDVEKPKPQPVQK